MFSERMSDNERAIVLASAMEQSKLDWIGLLNDAFIEMASLDADDIAIEMKKLEGIGWTDGL